MSTPEALGYAFCLDARGYYAEAAELRRQHAEIEHLTAALDESRAERSVAYLAFEQVTKERDALREALAEVDRLAGHDEALTDWRDRCAHLWDAQGREQSNG